MVMLARVFSFVILFCVMNQLLMVHVVKTSLKHLAWANLDPEEAARGTLSPRLPHFTEPAADFHVSVIVAHSDRPMTVSDDT